MKKIPLHSLVIMIGPSKAGKTTLASKSFPHYEILNYSNFKEEILGHDNKRDISDLILNEIVSRAKLKLSLGERVVIDGSHLKKSERAQLVNLASTMGINLFFIVVNRTNEDKIKSCPNLTDLIEISEKRFLDNEKEILKGDNLATVIDIRKETFEVVKKLDLYNVSTDIVSRGYKGLMVLGDVHGMRESLKTAIDWASARNLFMLFLGDIIDYGPHSIECTEIVYDLLIRGKASMIIGNHEKKIERWLEQLKEYEKTKAPIKLKLSEGNKMTTDKVLSMTPFSKMKFELKFNTILNLSSNHIVMDNYLFTHGGAEPEMFSQMTNRLSKRFAGISMYGEVDKDKQFNDDGYPNRIYNWVDRIPNGKNVIVGHDIRSVGKPLVVDGALGGKAIFMDTGSGKGGHLTTAHLTKNKSGEWFIENFSAH